jgi:hypothetical protein
LPALSPVKTLIFGFITILFCLNPSPALADDPYVVLPWIQVTAADLHQSITVVTHPSLGVFREALSQPTTFRCFLGLCGVPNAKYDFKHDKVGRTIPLFYGGSIFRYDLIDSDHVYVWTGEDDSWIVRAVYQPRSGPRALLYKRPL